PSRASERAMPLPMPSLPPVTSAVLPSSCRSMSVSRVRIGAKPFHAARGGGASRLPVRRSAAEDRLGGVAHRLDVLAHVEKRDDAARAAFEALVAPRKRADEAALVEHELDVAAEVLGMQQAFLEGPAVEGKYVGRDLAAGFLVHVVEGAEELARG